MSNDLVYNGVLIRDRGEMLSLTDMWRAAGSDSQKQPAKWRALPSVKEFCSYVADTLGKSESELFQVLNEHGEWNTWAHWQIGFAYAGYLNPEFRAWCNVAAREKMEGKRPIPLSRDQVISLGLIEACKVIDEKNKEIEELRPDANAHRRIKASEGSVCLRDAAKILRIPEKKFLAWLHAKHWIYRRPGSEEWIGYDYHTKNGDLEHVLHELHKRDGTTFNREQVLITVQGLAKLAKIFGNLDSVA